MTASAVQARLSRERRLRERIDELVDERDAARSRATKLAGQVAKQRKPYVRCVYCGERCRGRACADHRDLPRLDPHYEGSG